MRAAFDVRGKKKMKERKSEIEALNFDASVTPESRHGAAAN